MKSVAFMQNGENIKQDIYKYGKKVTFAERKLTFVVKWFDENIFE